MRKAAYTFITGNYDDLKSPAVVTGGWEYVCFTDNRTLSTIGPWKICHSVRNTAETGLEDKKFAMKHMILFHEFMKDYDLSLSVGGQVEINCDLDELFAEHFRPDDDMLITRHPWRDCIFEEGRVCAEIGKDTAERIDRQMQRYRVEEYPKHNGLYATGIIGRRHDRYNLKLMCERWFDELKRGSRRDQLSLNYALWSSPPVKISELDWDNTFVRRSASPDAKPNFILHPHLHQR